MKLIKFKDGKFGVRKGVWPFYFYRDFHGNYWWTFGSRFFNDCKTSEQTARNYLDKGEVVK